jgi:hypothetical protein
MKGPGFRLDLDVRRLWECPACGTRLKMPASVVQLDCDCRGESSPAMRLVEGLRRTESPFDHVGFAAQKRIDAAIKKPHGPLPLEEERSAGDLRPPEESLPETTHELDATSLPSSEAPSSEG